MPSLVELQERVYEAVTTHDSGSITLPLVGGVDPCKRIAIHRRHHELSLVSAIRDKFPATAWLIGEGVLNDAARCYVRLHRPERPCIAEYGETFPAYLQRQPRVREFPYVQDFAELEWHVAHVSIAVDRPWLSWSDIRRDACDTLLNARITLQPGLRWLQASWDVDQLMTAYLSDSTPDRFNMTNADVHVQIRGSRGTLALERIDPSTFIFRKALQQRQTLGDGAEAALDRDPGFDAGQALAALASAGLVTGVTPIGEGA
jgi:hypothetical protein